MRNPFARKAAKAEPWAFAKPVEPARYRFIRIDDRTYVAMDSVTAVYVQSHTKNSEEKKKIYTVCVQSQNSVWNYAEREDVESARKIMITFLERISENLRP